MGLETALQCPVCEEEQLFRRKASTNIHLGQKTKWACTVCDHRIVRVDGSIDTLEA